MVKSVVLGLIRLYQKTLSLDHGFVGKIFSERFCRFYPTCSEYSYQAIARYGVLRGSAIACQRIIRCHPWTDGGYDPLV